MPPFLYIDATYHKNIMDIKKCHTRTCFTPGSGASYKGGVQHLSPLSDTPCHEAECTPLLRAAASQDTGKRF